MKTILVLLCWTGLSFFVQAADTAAGQTQSDAIRREEQLRQALRQATEGKTNVVEKSAAAPAPAAVPAPAADATTTPLAAAGAATNVAPALPLRNPPRAVIPRTNSIVVPNTPSPAPPKEQVAGGPAGAAGTNAAAEEIISAGIINFKGVDLPQVLEIYAQYVGKTLLRVASLPAAPIFLTTQTDLTKREVIQALDGVLALNGIAIVPVGEKFLKVVQQATAGQEGEAFSKVPPDQLAEFGQYVTHVVQLKHAKPSELLPVLQPFSKIPNAIMAIDSSQILVLRDFTENIKRMLEMVQEVDKEVIPDYVSEVIPIKYALVSEIAGALNSLSTGGGGTTVGGGGAGGGARTGIGTGATGAGGGFNRSGGLNRPGYPGSTSISGTTPFGTTGGVGGTGVGAAGQPGASFSDRLQQIIRRASVSGEIQILGQTKIIADERTNSLLVFAGQQDMDMIKKIVSQLDVVLAQVLIESVILEVTLDDSTQLGISYLEKKAHGGDYFNGIGAIQNGAFLTDASFTALTNAAGAVGSGFSYLAHFGGDLDVTLTALADNHRVNVLSRPRIQTSHAVPATLFIGDTVPYITGTTFGDFAGVSSRSVYQERQVGINLSVLPLINVDGLVVMDIQEDIEQLGTTVKIDGNDVPQTTKRSAQAKVAVKDRDTVILGGMIGTSKSTSKSGVPFLKDLPLLGVLFRSSTDINKRVELIVMMRPTVLPTPEVAAAVATAERNNLPGIRRAESENRKDEAKRLQQSKKEFKDE